MASCPRCGTELLAPEARCGCESAGDSPTRDYPPQQGEDRTEAPLLEPGKRHVNRCNRGVSAGVGIQLPPDPAAVGIVRQPEDGQHHQLLEIAEIVSLRHRRASILLQIAD